MPTVEIKALFDAAKTAMGNSHSPYSNFPVGAAIRTNNGTIHAGCNVENASFPEGWCAETSAIAQMISSGEKRISEILVMAEKMHKVPPCGGCRQRIAEFSDEKTRIYLCDDKGEVETLTIQQLLPGGFELE